MITLWKGYHDKSLPSLLKQTWDDDGLMIFLPPLLTDYSFVVQLPAGPIACLGNWNEAERALVAESRRSPAAYAVSPVLGLFSSGSTGGHPKLVLYSKKNIEFSLQGVMKFFEAEKIDHVFCYPHPFHTFGLLLGYMLAITQGWRFTELEGKYNSHFHQQWLESVGSGTLTLGTPTHLKDLMHFVTSQGVTPRSSYSCIIGGAPVSPQLWQNVQDVLKIASPSVGYGATEASPALTHLPPGQKPLRTGDIGYSLQGIEMHLLPGSGFEFKGPNVCSALIQNNTVSFPEKIHLSDDLQKHSDGSFTFLGRTDFTLNRGGEKFKLEDVENHLYESLKLQVTALAVPDKRLGFDLALLIDGSAGDHPIPREEILHKLHEKYMVLFNGNHFLRTSQFPLNDSGKRDRQAAMKQWKTLFETSQKIYGTP